MKKLLLSLGLLTSTLSFSQITDCSQLFISEYVEGWGNNKALEIYNPTSADINLSGYFVARYSNGSTTATVANSVQLSGIVQKFVEEIVFFLGRKLRSRLQQIAGIVKRLEIQSDSLFIHLTANLFYLFGIFQFLRHIE